MPHFRHSVGDLVPFDHQSQPRPMMPHKFRVAVKEDGDTWAIHEPPHDYVLDGEGRLWFRRGGRTVVRLSDDVAVLRSTGLLDAEGTEVYEADIIGVTFGHCGVVEWNEAIAGYVVNVPTSENVTKLTASYLEDAHGAVLGTKYTDPHLLEPDAQANG